MSYKKKTELLLPDDLWTTHVDGLSGLSIRFTLGFRGGSRLLQHGCLLLLCSGALRWCCSLHAATFSVSRAWGRGVALSEEWQLLLVQAVLHALALVLTGFGLAALEAFHDRGSSGRAEQAARCLLPLYGLTAVSGEKRQLRLFRRQGVELQLVFFFPSTHLFLASCVCLQSFATSSRTQH